MMRSRRISNLRPVSAEIISMATIPSMSHMIDELNITRSLSTYDGVLSRTILQGECVKDFFGQAGSGDAALAGYPVQVIEHLAVKPQRDSLFSSAHEFPPAIWLSAKS
jgi:hypothetical protein